MKKLFEKPKQSEASMPPLDLDEEDLPRRGGNGPVWITVLCLVLAIALLVSSLPSAPRSSTSVRSSVRSCQAQTQPISSVLYGAGTLAPQEGTELTVPDGLEIQNYYVKNGQVLSEGDPIAAFDPVAVKTAVTELQSVLKDLDEAIASAYDSSPSSIIQAGTSGRVKKVYAEKDKAAADTMYEHGAMMLLSLDGKMAVDLETEPDRDAALTVTLSDGTELPGTVAASEDGVCTITVSDAKAPMDDAVTVKDENGRVLGEGTLYIHNVLRVTGVYGTVQTINASLNQKVSRGTTLITLKDTGRTATYQSLLSRRDELEEQLDSLLQLGSDGILRAKEAGIVSGVDTEIDYVSPDTLETRQRSQASPGYTRISGILMEGAGGDSGDNTDGGSSGGTGSESGGESGGGSGSGSGGESGGGTGGDTPEEDKPATYTIGYVVAAATYVPTGSAELAFGQSFSAAAAPTDLSGATAIPSGTVYLCTVSGWTSSDSTAIRVGDTVAIGGGNVVFLPGSGGGAGTPSMPGFDMSGLDLSSMLGGMMGGIAGSMGGYSMPTVPTTPSYESYDTTQKTVVTLTGQKEMTVDFPVDELDILSLKVGMDAEITLDALPGQRFSGSITKINTYGENSGGNTKYTVTVTLPREAQMLSGMNASVQIAAAVSQAVPTLPAAAIQFQGGTSWVYTGYDEKTDTLTDLAQVETGLSDGTLVELCTSFPEGTTFYYRYADSIEYRFER
ncbi:MAG: HlyD family efflux transporter periplasmic adaptor subunit [Candidatus Faecousia sp.]|nr:HlyD family efflux transporter periplasmic adaptor subunit [Candidatus Faecousia sp.]